MAVLFSVTTSALLALYALWSAWFVLADLRDDLRGFLDHEGDELALAIGRSDGSAEALAALVDDIASVSEDPMTAFRVYRQPGGELLVEGGGPQLLAAVPGPLGLHASWREHLLSAGVATRALVEPRHDVRLEVLLDARPALAVIRRYLLSAGAALLAAVGLAALAGWFTAHRGLAGLRRVVEHARGVDGLSPGVRLDLAGTPREVREVGAAFEAMIARIEEGLTAMRTFTAGLAHELRSPLQNLTGETEVALLSERSPDEYRRVLQSNLEDLAELSDAVDNLVAFCRASEPHMKTVDRENFDLAEEARLRLERERRSAERAGVEVELASAGDTRLVADREGCLRVLRNLVGNAIQWSPRDSVVHVRLVGEPHWLHVEVEDEGPGVPVHLGTRIFDPFVTHPRQGRRQGYGLGLAICRTVLDEHGGRLRYENTPGGGARFIASFPRGRVATDAGQPLTPVAG
jgi:two-component system heavy metal sensor histidine kinase CusS